MVEIRAIHRHEADIVAFPVGRAQPRPCPGEVWRHHSGALVDVICLGEYQAGAETTQVVVHRYRDDVGENAIVVPLEHWRSMRNGEPIFTQHQGPSA